jgi:hypothetical protein
LSQDCFIQVFYTDCNGSPFDGESRKDRRVIDCLPIYSIYTGVSIPARCYQNETEDAIRERVFYAVNVI